MHLRACGGQFAHAPSRRRAVCAGRLVTRDAACGAAAARKAVHPVISLPARLRRASRAPGLCLCPASHARGLFPGARPRRAPVFPGREKAWLLFPEVGRNAGQKPALNFHFEKNNVGPNVPARTETPEKLELCSFGFSGVSLISRRFAAQRAVKPASSETKGEIGERARASPFAQKRPKS